MAITVLNNISDLTAEQALSSTQASLQKTLTQLSTGLKINSGSDDAAGLAIANGITANIAALTQSQQNVANGIGLLQTTDGALSQVTTLTIATEGSTGGISTSQYAALNTEFSSIKAEIDQIGNATNFNGENVFSNNTVTSYTSTQGTLVDTTALAANETVTISDTGTGGTFVFNTGATGSTVGALNTAIAGAVTSGTLSANVTGVDTTGNEVISEASTDPGIIVTTTSAELGGFTSPATGGSGTVYVGDGTTTGTANTQITAVISALSSTLLGLQASGITLTSAADSQASLAVINKAVTTISAERGTIGASVNRINAESSVIGDQITNLQAAVNVVENADIGATVANLTQFNVLESTGIAALQQANQAQQNVLKLVQ
jgi:flagellin